MYVFHAWFFSGCCDLSRFYRMEYLFRYPTEIELYRCFSDNVLFLLYKCARLKRDFLSPCSNLYGFYLVKSWLSAVLDFRFLVSHLLFGFKSRILDTCEFIVQSIYHKFVLEQSNRYFHILLKWCKLRDFDYYFPNKAVF